MLTVTLCLLLNAVNFPFFLVYSYTCWILGWKRHGLGRNTLIEIIGRAQDENVNDHIRSINFATVSIVLTQINSKSWFSFYTFSLPFYRVLHVYSSSHRFIRTTPLDPIYWIELRHLLITKISISNWFFTNRISDSFIETILESCQSIHSL